MYWTLELASKLEDAPWPATKEELIDYATRSGAPLEVLENLQEIEDEGDVYDSIEDIWPDYPSKDDFLWNKPAATCRNGVVGSGRNTFHRYVSSDRCIPSYLHRTYPPCGSVQMSEFL